MNIKRILSVALCFLLLLSFGLGSYAETHRDSSFVSLGNTTQEEPSLLCQVPTEEQAGEYLKKIGLYKGYEDGSLGLDRNITRAEFATLAVRIEGMEDVQEKHRGETIFKDMAASHWASGYVNIAVSKDLIKGFEDKTFRPEEEITYVQALAVVIRILGYEKDVVGEWPDNYIEKGMDLGLDRHIGLSADDVINRGEIAVLIYNALEITIQ